MAIIVAMDGPSGAGKSSTSKAIAKRAGWNYLDTGALYRGATWLALQKGINTPNELVIALKEDELVFNPHPDSPTLKCGDIDITKEIRSEKVTEQVSFFAAMPEVRDFLVTLQRRIISQADKGIVVEGRDIGTVVAKNAHLKVYLTANLDARAKRREVELKTDKDLSAALEQRDQKDSSRTVSPLEKAIDAILIDSTEISLDETVDQIWELLKERQLLGLPIVAILGRPNVGKSSLINRFIGKREAIVEDVPGVTRDRVRYECEWNSREFILMDTGGWESKPDGISIGVSAGAELAIEEADVILFVVDAQVGAQSEDEVMVNALRKSGKKIFLVANKVDSPNEEAEAHSLWNLGLGEPHFVTALHGKGSADLLDLMVAALPEVGSAVVKDNYRKVALIGKPNVGKSSLLNAIAGDQLSLVDDKAGTTRDPVDSIIEFGGTTWRFVDTAGIKKRANQASGSDYYAVLRTQVALERAEVVALVLDASEPLAEQDLKIISLVEEAGKALVLVMNKWDLVDEDRRIALEKELDRHLTHITWAQRVNVAAKTGWHRDRLAPALRTALQSWETRIPTGKLNSFLGALIGATPPPVRGGKQPKIFYATQAGIAPPKFVIFTNDWIEPPYRRFIERKLREEFGFEGSPVQVSVKIRERD
jgi:GTP-binding protein